MSVLKLRLQYLSGHWVRVGEISKLGKKEENYKNINRFVHIRINKHFYM